MISCIILAAGLSSRFGSPKALAMLGNTTVIEHVQNTMINNNINEIIIVLGAYSEQILPFILKHKKVKSVYNKDYNFGQTSSFKIGVKSVCKSSKGIMLLPVDYPLVKPEILNFLCDLFLSKKPKIIIPTFDGKRGHPSIYNMSLKKEIMSLDNSMGINSLNHKYCDDLMTCNVEDCGVVLTFNTEEEFLQIKSKLQNTD